MSEFQTGNGIPEVRASALLKKRRMWAFPLVVGSLMIGLMTLIYFGSIVDPTGHFHGRWSSPGRGVLSLLWS